MSMKTEQRIRAWLSDQANITTKRYAIVPQRGFEHDIMREHFTTSNGITVSIQQGASHYCDEDSVEMWCCPHHPILAPFSSDEGDNPYGWVPISVAAQYIDILEGEATCQEQ